VAQRKPFLLRLDPTTHEAMQRWADAEIRSLNAQIEFVLRHALREEGRLPAPEPVDEAAADARKRKGRRSDR
jgi:hypothetical protein